VVDDDAAPSSSSAERGSLWLAFAAAARAEEAAADEAIARDYQAQLSTPALVAAVRGLLFSERRAGRLVCRYLADLADRIHERQDGELGAYVDEFHAAACFFDLGARETRERVRIGRALRSLPQIETASPSKAPSKAPAGGASAVVDLAVNQTPPGETKEPTPRETATERRPSNDPATRGLAIDRTTDGPTAGERTTQIGFLNEVASRGFAVDGTRDEPTAREKATQRGTGASTTEPRDAPSLRCVADMHGLRGRSPAMSSIESEELAY
jgi:hypothetical protein